MAKTINMADLRGKSEVALKEFIKDTTKQLLDTRFQNYTNQLANTSSVGKLRRDLARALTVKNELAAKSAVKA
jgi:large subunit ribosomal protein L29